MANKVESDNQKSSRAPVNAFSELQNAGLGSVVGMGAAWVEAISNINAEVMYFITERIKEDVKTQHEIMHCKNAGELQHIQAKFLQKAIDQYQAETGKLVEMGANAFKPITTGNP